MNEEQRDLYLKCINDFSTRKVVYDKMYDYCITGKTDAYREYKHNEHRSNLRIRTNFIKKFIKEEVSYLLSNPITFTSKSDNSEFLQAIRDTMAHWDALHDRGAFRDMLSYGSVFELYYMKEINNEQTFNAKIVSPRNGYLLLDQSTGDKEAFFRFFYKKFDKENIGYIDIYTKDWIYHVDRDLKELNPPTPNLFGEVPVTEGIISPYREFDTLFNEISDLVDGYQTNLSDIVNEISDYRLAYLILSGCTLDDETKDENGNTDVDNMKRKGVLELPQGGDAKFLVKNINDSFIKNTLDTLKKNMYELANHIDTNEKLQSNLSGSAIKNRLIGLVQKVRDGEGSMTDLIRGRFYFMCKFLSLTNRGEFDYRDVKQTYTLNVPQDDLLTSQTLSQAPDGLFSKETMRAQYSFVSDPISEGRKADAEIIEELNNVEGLGKPSKDDEIDEN